MGETRELAVQAAGPEGGIAVGAPSVSAPGLARRVTRRLTKYSILPSCGLLFIALTLSSDRFLTSDNLVNVLEQNAPVGIMALGLTIVMLGGDLDFSLGAVYGFAGIVATQADSSIGAWPALAVGVGVGVAIGLINGVLVTYGKIDSFIATFATGIVVAGLALVVTNGALINSENPQFNVLGTETLFGLQYAAWIFVLGGAALSWLMVRTLAGRFVYATGDNYEAARLSGVPTRVVRTAAFCLAGLTAGLAGVIVASQTSQGQPQGGLDLVTTAIAAVVVGGTSVGGGRGAVWRTIFGILFLAMITNGLNLLAISPIYQQVLFGGIILASVLLARLRGDG